MSDGPHSSTDNAKAIAAISTYVTDEKRLGRGTRVGAAIEKALADGHVSTADVNDIIVARNAVFAGGTWRERQQANSELSYFGDMISGSRASVSTAPPAEFRIDPVARFRIGVCVRRFSGMTDSKTVCQ
jgi:hypothetical protein